MRTSVKLLLTLAITVLTILLAGPVRRIHAGSRAAAGPPPAIGSSDIGGVVTSTKGPEAGVWVIAETKDLPTGFRKIVVTDAQGRYVVPDLPKATYKLWVRGYGLVDSKPIQANPGKSASLTAVIAPSARAAAEYYPADYWFSLIKVPPKSSFPMEKLGFENQLQWIAAMKGTVQFFQMGDKATREVPEALGKFASTKEAWNAWINSGEGPVSIRRLGPTALDMYADWTDRIAAGEVPSAPQRPQGIERNVVVTEWDWGNDKSFIHDVSVSDTRNPARNANGLVYGLEQFSADRMDILNPMTNSWSDLPVPMRDHDMKQNYVDFLNGVKGKDGIAPAAPLEYGSENVRAAVMRLHNSAFDQDGRLWITGKFRKGADQPGYCKQGSDLASAKFFPLNSFGGEFGLQAEVYDPETRQFTMVDTCFATMHLAFAEDADNTVWFSGANSVVGYVKTKVFEQTGDAAKAQGWCPYILDTNGNGKVDTYVGPTDAVDPTKDKQILYGSYGIAVNPADGSVWEGQDRSPGSIIRVDPGANPPYTCKTEIYNAPAGTSNPKGVWVDRNGLVWVAFAGSGTLASFDRRKCKVLNGPSATGDHCPEGWTTYPIPGPKFQNVTDAINADWHYLDWVDQFNTLGLGKNVPLAPGTNSDSMIAFLPDSKKFVVMHVPYPLGFFSRGMDGRIDDPNAGWKGRGLWTTYASISPWNVEGGKGATPKVVKFQVRPDPLAR